MSRAPHSAWFPRFSPGDVLVLLRAIAAPRTLLVVLGAAAWTIGVGWMAAMLRYNLWGGGDELFFNGLVVALLVFALPSMCAVVVSEAIQELLRRPLTNRLPAMAQRMGAAASTLGFSLALVVGIAAYLVSSPESLSLEASGGAQPTLLGYVSLALLGYAAGAWMRAHLGSSSMWLASFALFVGLAFGAIAILGVASASAIAALAVVALAAAATWVRFHPNVCARVAKVGMPTTFQFLSGLSGGAGAPVELLGDGGRRLPSGATGGNLRGWWSAHRYEHQTLRRSLGKDSGLFWMAVGTFLACFVLSLLKSAFGVDVTISIAGVKTTGAPISELLGGAGAEMDLVLESSLRGALLIVGCGVAAVAASSSTPLGWRFPYPIARRQRASLTLLVAARTLTLYLVFFVGMALLARIWVLPLLGVEPAPGVPPIVRVFLVQCALFAPYSVLSLWTRYQMRRGRRLVSYGLLVVGMGLLLASAGSLHRWADAPLWDSSWKAALGLAGALVLGFSLLALALSCHYRRCDLA